MVLADRVGRGLASDAYQAAFQIPDILNHILAVGAISIALIPLYQRAREKQGEAAAHRLLATVLGTVSALALAATAVLWLEADALVALQFPRFDAEQHALTVRLTRIVLPGQVFFVAGGILRAGLMAEGRFAAQAAAPLIYNLGIITGGLVGGGALGVEGFAWGALLGAAVGAFGISAIDALRCFPVRVRIAPLDPGFLRYVAVVTPLLLGVTVVTADEWYGRWFGGLLETGSIATLAFARRLMQAPVGLVGQAVGTAALPSLSRLFEDGRHGELRRVLLVSLRASLGLSVLIAAALAALAGPVVALIYVRGAFTPADAVPVTSALRVFCLGIPGWVVQAVAVRAFYARGDTWRPLLLGTVVAVGSIPAYLALGRASGAAGIAGAGALAVSANALATLVLARRLHGMPPLGPLAVSALRAGLVALAAGLAAAAAARGAGALLPARGALAALRDLACGGAAFAALAVPGIALFGDAPTREALRRLARRLARLRRPAAG
jgi:putative peptidoglycan lipid II flippase